MNQAIKELNLKLEALDADRSDIETQLQAEWNNVFNDSSVIKDLVTKVENSQNYRWDKYGEIVSYVPFNAEDFRDCSQYFKEYMRDNYFVELDFDNAVVTYSQGPGIVINDNGDVYDQDGDKFFIKKNDYRDDETGELDEAKRNELIEQYMEKTGCYPGVFLSDRHGNVFAVSTKKVE